MEQVYRETYLVYIQKKIDKSFCNQQHLKLVKTDFTDEGVIMERIQGVLC